MTITRLKSALKQNATSKDQVLKTKTILKKNSNTKRKSSKPHLKFAGPIKILIIEPQAEYCKRIWCAVGVGLTHVCVGATNLSVLHYSLNNGDSHATVCCLAFHFFSAEAILSLNYANGWSAPMRLKHRKCVHVFLQLCGTACAVTGTVLAVLAKGISMKFHGLTGLIAAVLAGGSVLSGFIALLGNRPGLRSCHLFFGLPTFITASISLCSGLFSDLFTTFAGSIIVYILIAFVSFYTLFIVASSFLKCLSRF